MDFSVNRQQLKGAMLRRIPHDGNLLPRSLIAWAGVATRSAADAPAILEARREPNEAGEPDFSLVAMGWSQRLDVSTSRHRYRPALYSASTANKGAGALKSALAGNGNTPVAPEHPERQRQNLLQPVDLYVLAHLLHLVKYSHTPQGVAVDSIDYRNDIELFVRPSALIEKMGYALSGDRYQRVEDSLKRLASFVLLHETRPTGTGEWQFHQTMPLLRLVDTGSLLIADAEAQEKKGARLSEWRIVLGPFLRRALTSAPSDLAMVPRSLWLSAGRSVASQYCALYVSQHGYDRAHKMYATRLDTLVQRAKILDADSERALFDTQQLKMDLERDQQGSTALRDRLRSAERCFRRRQQHLLSAFKRLGARLGIADIRYSQGSGDDVPPSKKGHRPSASDLLAIVRLPANIESGLSQLPATGFKKVVAMSIEHPANIRPVREAISNATDDTIEASRVASFCTRLIDAPALAKRWLRRSMQSPPVLT